MTKYKIEKQYRLPDYDYSKPAIYFITINSWDKNHFFGKIGNQEMFLSDIGNFVERNLATIAEKVKHLVIEESAIMPDHIHLLVRILNISPLAELQIDNAEQAQHDDGSATTIRPLQKKSIPSFVNHFKGKVKRWCNEHGHEDFEWGNRYHDMIIRDERHYHNVIMYIRNNVRNW